jgi:stress response protein YsnF
MAFRAVYADNGEYLGSVESADGERSVLLLASGERVSVPTEVLAMRGDGSLELQAVLREVGRATGPSSAPEPATEAPVHALNMDEPVRVPLLEEQLAVHKTPRERGRVAVHVTPQVEKRLLEIPLKEQYTEVRHVPVRRLVDEPPAVRQEGDTVIIPVLEEVLVVEKRLMLREEIHLIRQERTRIERREVRVRRERAEVRRTPPG